MPQAQTRHVPCGLPLDEATRIELLDASKGLRAAQNVRQTKRGSLEKRLGFKSIALTRLGLGSRNDGQRLASFRGAPVIIGAYAAGSDETPSLDIYDEAASASLYKGIVPEFSVSEAFLPRAPGQSLIHDVASAAGFVVVAYGENMTSPSLVDRAYVAVCDAKTGIPALPVQAISGSGGSNSLYVALSSFSSRYVIAFVHEFGVNIKAYIFDAQSAASGFVLLATVSATASTSAFAFISSTQESDRAIIAYLATDAAASISVKSYNASGLLESTTVAVSSVPTVLCADSLSGGLWVAWVDSTAMRAKCLNATSLATVIGTTGSIATPGATERQLGICSAGTGSARAYLHEGGGAGPIAIRTVTATVTAGAVVGGSVSVAYNAAPVTRMFRVNQRVYIGVCSSPEANPTIDANTQRLLTVVDVTNNGTTFRPVGHFDPNLIVECFATAHVPVDDTYGDLLLAYGVLTRARDVSFSTQSSIKLARLSFTDFKRWQNTTHNDALYIAGGILAEFNGERVAEAGFLASPPKPTVAGVAGTANATYKYVAVYEDTDSSGKVTVSGVSAPVSFTAVNQTIQITVKPITVSARALGNGCRITLYRTEAGGAPPYYFLGVTANNPSAASFMFSDGGGSISSNRKLYAPNLPGVAGESLDRRGPAWMTDIVSYGGILVGARGSMLVWSGQQVYGEACWFNPIFELPLAGEGAITALASQDGTLYVFRETEIYAVVGEPPNDNGTSGGLGIPRRLAVDVGCINARSVVVTSLGIFFQSRRGIELLSRAQAVEPIGDPISPELDTWPVVTSVVLDDQASLVRISLTNNVGTNGVDLVYDLTLKYWVSVDSKRGSSAQQRTAGACVVENGDVPRYAWLSTDGNVYIERQPASDGTPDTTPWLDGGGTWVTASFQTGQWNYGPQQEQKVYGMQLLAERYSAAGLQITSQPDYGDGSAKVHAWTEGETSGKRQFDFRPKLSGHSSILTVTDTAPATLGTGRGFCFVALSSDTAPVQGPSRGTPRIVGRK